MSTVEANVEVAGDPVPEVNDLELTEARAARVGPVSVRRMLPLRLRRSVGAWCFIDHYGPMDVDGAAGMNVPPHPHIGLQTVTWLLAGNVLHRDSLGSEQLIRPGQLNLMTSGRGIAHAEESPAVHDPTLHGVQLWVALPDASRQVEPAFEHHGELPATGLGGFAITVLIGELAGASSPATDVLADCRRAAVGSWRAGQLRAAAAARLRARLVRGDRTGRAQTASGCSRGSCSTSPAGRHEIALAAPAGSTLMLLGGEPLREQLLMWWNFVARTPEEIGAATSAWRAGQFGPVGGYQGEPMPAPPLDIALLQAAAL